MGLLNTIKKIGREIERPFDQLNDKTTDVLHTVTGIPTAQQNRAQMTAAKEQMDLYRKQTQITQDEIARTKADQATARSAINEKQIRANRGRYESAGFLDAGNDNTSKLGG